jgi:predicted RNA-binding Zn ribbon-like protein
VVVRNAPRDLPEDLALPLASGAAWWYWLGTRPAVDFVNTRRERWRRDVETLITPTDLSAWLQQVGLTDRPMPVPKVVLGQARELREAIDACVVAVVGDGGAAASASTASPADAVALVDEWLAFAGDRPQLRLEGGVPVLGERHAADSPRRALGMLALDAAVKLGTASERARVRICASETCSARFNDRSPAGRRRWCSMQTCGNAAKARRHRARRREILSTAASAPRPVITGAS